MSYLHLADDEPEARALLRFYLAQVQDIRIVGECQNGRETVACLKSTSANLLFLDIEMPGLGGFEVVEQTSGAASCQRRG
jgi:two-component system LytT family response regulator